MSKLEQIERLARHGLPVPLTSRLTPDLSLDLARWGRYAVVKPLLGRQGEDVHLVRTENVAARYAELTQNGTREMLIQPYVEHTENGYPTEYRVMTVFGRAVYSARNSWAMPRQTTLEDIANDPNGIIASNSKQFGRARTVSNDPDIISLGERAHAAFPDIPVLGVDVVRETGGRGLFIMEVNPKGDTWHLSSLLRKTAFTDQHAQDLYAQFGALDRVAQVLIEETARRSQLSGMPLRHGRISRPEPAAGPSRVYINSLRNVRRLMLWPQSISLTTLTSTLKSPPAWLLSSCTK